LGGFGGKLDFSWDEVHEIAEQLEHIKSEKLINKLDDFRKPYRRPSWGSIPNAKGQVLKIEKQLLWNLLRIKKESV
jgi:DtxR family Mn-dependent transcriptional regulator